MNRKDKFKGKEAVETAFKEFKKREKSNFMDLMVATKNRWKLCFVKIKFKKRMATGIVIGLACVMTLGGAFIFTTTDRVYAVTIDGKNIGYVDRLAEVDSATAAVKDKLAENYKDLKLVVTDDRVACVPTQLKEKDVSLMDGKALKEAVAKSDIVAADAWTVNVDDKPLLAVTTKKEAEAVLNDVERHYEAEPAPSADIGFKEDVKVKKAAVSPHILMNEEEATNFLLTGEKQAEEYTVKQGDTFEAIAARNGMSLDELKGRNPEINPSKLKAGMELNVMVSKPYLTVVSKEVVTSMEDMDFATKFQDTNTLYAGDVKVILEGERGQKEVRTEIVKENGVEVTQSGIGARIISEPKNALALVGTKEIAGYDGPSSGLFGMPMAKLDVSSPYGNRGGERHLGVDLRNPAGTPIYAVENGVVIFSGPSGSYGNLVKIDHGNGLTTYYAHCSKLLVTVGQTVTKGEEIAEVGATGNATGNHLHFEVRLNGVPQNPWAYI